LEQYNELGLLYYDKVYGTIHTNPVSALNESINRVLHGIYLRDTGVCSENILVADRLCIKNLGFEKTIELLEKQKENIMALILGIVPDYC